MNHFERHESDGALWCEDVPLAAIAGAVGTPTYVYSRATIERHARVWHEAWSGLDHLGCFAVKACSSLAVLSLLAKAGLGFDIVSAGELQRVLRAGGDPNRVVFSGVGKQADELRMALEVGARGIHCFNVESPAELDMLAAVARSVGRRAPVSLRVNPDVDAETHPYIATGLRRSKFGIAWEDAPAVYARAAAMPELAVIGVDCHIGSQLAKSEPFVAALDRLLDLVAHLQAAGIPIDHIDIGGGLGITYREEAPPSPAEYAAAVRARLASSAASAPRAPDGRPLTIVTEPGRVIVGNAGCLLTRCILTKQNGDARFVVVDAGMNDLLRPALYSAWHAIEPVAAPRAAREVVDVVGPVCETGDFFAKDRELPVVAAGELLAVRSAGAYAFAMASNYNSRPRAAEVLVDGARFDVIRARETFDDLIRGEIIPGR
ncbi:MAG: diaminopimelate decarboxylase [Myxococcota bacterium]